MQCSCVHLRVSCVLPERTCQRNVDVIADVDAGVHTCFRSVKPKTICCKPRI
jgi:hypothetical protein